MLLAGSTTVMSVDALRDSFFSLMKSLFCQYEEQTAIRSDQFSDMLYCYDGKIVWEQNTKTGSAFVDETGKQWVEVPEDAPGFGALDFDGNLLMADKNADNNELTVTHYDPDGKAERTVKLRDLPKPAEGEFLKVQKLLADRDFLYLLIRMQGGMLETLLVYDWDGNLLSEYKDTVDVTIDGQGCFYSLTGGLQQQTPYSILKGDMKNRAESLKSPVYGFPCQIDYNRKDGNLYLSTASEVAVYDPLDGKKLRTVLTIGQDTSFYPEEISYYYDFAVAEDGSLYFNFSRYSDEDTAFRFYQEIIPFLFDAASEPEKVKADVAVTVPYANEFLSDAAMRYEREHPGTVVMLDTEYPSWEAWLYGYVDYDSDALMKRLAAGETGNVVQLSELDQPIRESLGSELLLDLTPYLEKSGLQSSMNPAVWEEMKTDGAIRGIPMGYQVSCLAVDAALADKIGADLSHLDSWADLFDLLSLLEEKAPGVPLFNGTRDEVFHLFIQSVLPEQINLEQRTVSLDEEQLRKDLTALRAVFTNPNLAQDLGNSVTDPLMGSMFAAFELGEGYLRDDYSRLSDYPDYRLIPMPGAVLYQPQEIYAIPADADNPDAAWEFLEYLAEEKAQSLNSRLYLPVNEAGWDSFAEWTGNFFTWEDRQRFSDFEKIAKGAATMRAPAELEKIFAVQCKRYLYGSQTFEETLRNAEEELSAALSAQKGS